MGTIKINGHEVDEHEAENFLDGETGLPISDEEWDESKRRLLAAEPNRAEGI